jgi:Kef-type K+ transport system membrane component KefB/CBS domain-containing protein
LTKDPEAGADLLVSGLARPPRSSILSGTRRESFEATLEHSVRSLLPLAIALLASLLLGRVASRFGVPRVTAYLLVGLALGPHGLMQVVDTGGAAGSLLLGDPTVVPLSAVSQLAIGFILFGVGAEFRFETFRRAGPRAATLSGIEIGTTGTLVAFAVLVGTGDWALAVIAPALAIASAPSATLVTLREVEAEGPTTSGLILSVGHNNLAALLLFPVLLSLAFGIGSASGAVMQAVGALVGGAALGLAAAVWLEAIDGRRELVLLGILLVVAILGLAGLLGHGAVGLGMLGCFGAGVALTNASPHATQLNRYVENTVYPLYVLFFIAAGRDLHVDALLAAGWLGVLFIGARAAGKFYGARLGLEAAGWGRELPPAFGAGLMCQAGVALGLVTALEAADADRTAHLRHVVVASVVVFELIGPWLVRRTVIAGGEVKLANIVPHVEASGFDAVHWVRNELRRNLGIARGSGSGEATGGATVEHAMRRRPQTVQVNLPFERVLKTLGEAHSDLLPVVDDEGRIWGVISYDDVKNTLYDPVLHNVVIAGDLTSPVEDPLDPETPLATALEVMDRHQVNSWPVVRENRLLGMMRRSDAYALMRRELSRRRES